VTETRRSKAPSLWLLREPIVSRAAGLTLALGAVAMLALLTFVGRWLTFWHDEWDWIFERRDPSVETLLAPHVDHLSTVAVLVYQGLLRTFGLTSYFPYLAVSWALHFASVALLFVIARRRAGPLFGLAAGLSLLFLGSAYEVLLNSFLMTFLLSTTFGLLAVERLSASTPARARYVVAGIALLVAVGSSSVGVLFTGLVVVWAVLDRDWRRLLTTVPTVTLYAVWYVSWGRSASGLAGTTESDLALVPAKFLYGIGASVVAVAGLPPERFAWLGLGLAMGLAVLVAIGRRFGARFTSLACAALLALVAEYGLQAVFRARFGIEQSTRSAYLYPAAIFVWLAAVEILAAWRHHLVRRPPIVAGLAILLAIMVVGNMTQFVGAARASRTLRQAEIAELRLLEAMAASPALDRAAVPVGDVPQITAGAYLEAISILGAPHLAIAEPTLTDIGPVDPQRMDATLIRLLDGSFAAIEQEPDVTPPEDVVTVGAVATDRSDGCLRLETQGDGASASWQPAGDGVVIRDSADPDSDVRVGVFGEPTPLLTAGALPDGSRTIALPELPSGLRWTVLVAMMDGQVVEICDIQP
jgi:hypothetical protein